jgi:hypothetical protein
MLSKAAEITHPHPAGRRSACVLAAVRGAVPDDSRAVAADAVRAGEAAG